MTFLNTLLSTEIEYRIKRRVEKNMTGLLDCHWIDNKENLLFFGPPDIGKTHLAIAFTVAVVEKDIKFVLKRSPT